MLKMNAPPPKPAAIAPLTKPLDSGNHCVEREINFTYSVQIQRSNTSYGVLHDVAVGGGGGIILVDGLIY